MSLDGRSDEVPFRIECIKAIEELTGREELTTGVPRVDLHLGDLRPTCLDFSPDGETMYVTASHDNAVVVMDIPITVSIISTTTTIRTREPFSFPATVINGLFFTMPMVKYPPCSE